MFTDDDFLLSIPARRESAAAFRIAMMALTGCLALLAVLVIQARAESDAMLHGPVKSAHTVQFQHRHPLHPQLTSVDKQNGSIRPTC